jgi:hypothetical protein
MNYFVAVPNKTILAYLPHSAEWTTAISQSPARRVRTHCAAATNQLAQERNLTAVKVSS